MAFVKCGNKFFSSIEELYINDISENRAIVRGYSTDPSHGIIEFGISTELLKLNCKGDINILHNNITFGELFIFGNINNIQCTKHICIEGSRAMHEMAFSNKISVSELTRYSEIKANYDRTVKELSDLFSASETRIVNIQGRLNNLHISLKELKCFATIKSDINMISSESDLIIKGDTRIIQGNSITYLQ